VQALHVELSLALKLHEPHRRSGRSLSDRFGIAVVVLLRFDLGTHILGRHQPDLVTVAAKQTAKMMRAAARFHRHHAARHPRGELDHAVSAQPPTQDHPSGYVQTHDAAAVLAQINPKNRNLHGTTPLLRLTSQRNAAGGGAGHSIKRWKPLLGRNNRAEGLVSTKFLIRVRRAV
jgi:hypothetical protein